jgi:hypothetical protein
MKKLINRYTGLNGIIAAALDATILTAIISLAIIATV